MTQPYGSLQHPDPNGGYPPQTYGYPQPVPMRTNGLAIASMVLSIVGFPLMCAWGVGFIPALLGVIFGHIAKNQIKNDGTQGAGMALAGIVIGYCVLGLIALVVLLAFLGLGLIGSLAGLSGLGH